MSIALFLKAKITPVPGSVPRFDACLMKRYLHGISRYEKLLGDLLISEATGNQGKDFALPLG